ncbi:hypothetical protein [Mameliella sp.]|uniref:hypothetical protein n=1 Tax=Mameliella sp. TaxID=1924940 RepID=UPI003B50C02E
MRFHELWKNYEDMRSMGFNPSGSYSAEGSRITRSGTNVGVNNYRLKSFLTDYRHFSGQEPANFKRMCNFLQEICSNKDIETILAHERKSWDDAGILAGWHNDFTAEDVISAMDKEEVFHTIRTGKGNHVTLTEVKARIDENALWAEISTIVFNRMLAIRNVNYVIQPLLNAEASLQVPSQMSTQ